MSLEESLFCLSKVGDTLLGGCETILELCFLLSFLLHGCSRFLLLLFDPLPILTDSLCPLPLHFNLFLQLGETGGRLCLLLLETGHFGRVLLLNTLHTDSYLLLCLFPPFLFCPQALLQQLGFLCQAGKSGSHVCCFLFEPFFTLEQLLVFLYVLCVCVLCCCEATHKLLPFPLPTLLLLREGRENLLSLYVGSVTLCLCLCQGLLKGL
mmetsp:Transcript_40169/g.79162  ORF Transcript_40169/g.79162 Transcript_40169/m.79162 type:complete len:209 (+) Transcript_40169:1119-1745(+)